MVGRSHRWLGGVIASAYLLAGANGIACGAEHPTAPAAGTAATDHDHEPHGHEHEHHHASSEDPSPAGGTPSGSECCVSKIPAQSVPAPAWNDGPLFVPAVLPPVTLHGESTLVVRLRGAQGPSPPTQPAPSIVPLRI